MTSLVFGSLPFPGQSGDRLVSKAVSAAIAALFKQTGKIEANVKAEPVAKLLQGSVDGFDFVGHDLLMNNGLRIEAMELYVQAVSIDFSAIFSGQVKLRQPTQATMRVVLSQSDLTTSFNTPFVVEKLQRLQYQDQSLHFRNTQMKINDDKSIGIVSEGRIGEGEEVHLDLSAQIHVEDRRKIQFVEVVYNGEGTALELGQALIAHINNLMDLDKFALDGTQLKVDRIRIRDQELIFYGIAAIDRFPKGKKG
jgi:hypothetical protein